METGDSGLFIRGIQVYTAAGQMEWATPKQVAQAVGARTTATTPLTGATITADSLGFNQFHYITPAGTIAALTLTLPPLAGAFDGQIVTIFSTQIITALTIAAGSGTTLGGTTLSAAAANTTYRFQLAGTVWVRL